METKWVTSLLLIWLFKRFEGGLIKRGITAFLAFPQLKSSQVQVINDILAMRVIAVVGLSKDPAKPSHDVASYLQKHGYTIVPINPTITEVLGERSYPSLLDLPEDLKTKVEVVDVFRKAEDVPPTVNEAIQLYRINRNPRAVWLQLGIVNEASARQASEAGLMVVMDRCMKIEHAQRSHRQTNDSPA